VVIHLPVGIGTTRTVTVDLENLDAKIFWPLELLWIAFSFWLGLKFAKKTTRNEWDV
jgi:hypothetical protein